MQFPLQMISFNQKLIKPIDNCWPIDKSINTSYGQVDNGYSKRSI